MTSKVLVKMPEVPFSQVNNVKKPTNDLVAVSSNNDLLRSVNQLQENIRFLQAKHQNMLTRLHDEVDILKQKNRDLQFQLVFSKNSSSNGLVTPTSQSEPEAKPVTTNEETSPIKEVESNNDVYKNRCLQLEKELTTTKTALQTSLARTAALQALLQQHKIQEVPWATQQCSRAAAMIDSRSGTELAIDGGEEAGRLQTRLEEAERLVRRLRAETDEQRRELQSIKASLSAGGRGSGGRGGGGHRAGPHQRFPPLQSNQQPFWQQQGPSQQREESPIENSSKKVACQKPGDKPKSQTSYIQLNILKIREKSLDLRKSSTSNKNVKSDSIPKVNNEYQVWNRGNRRLNEKSDSGLSQVLGVNTALPDLRGTNVQQPYNGNMNTGQNQNQPRRGAGNHGYNNHYYRNSDRGHRGGDSRNYRDDDQHKTYNSPNDLSEGETENVNDHVRNNSYKNKRGHNKHQDKT